MRSPRTLLPLLALVLVVLGASSPEAGDGPPPTGSPAAQPSPPPPLPKPRQIGGPGTGLPPPKKLAEQRAAKP